MGWTGLILVNILVVGWTIYAFYFYTYKYKIKKFYQLPSKLTDFVSESYFNQGGRFFEVFYTKPINKGVLLAHMGYVVIRVAIVTSFFATLHNYCQFYNSASYDALSEMVKRPLLVIYGILMLSYLYFSFYLWNKEYECTK